MKFLIFALSLVPSFSFAANLENGCKVDVSQAFTDKWPVAVASASKELTWYETSLVEYDGISIQASIVNDPVLKDKFFVIRFKKSQDHFSAYDMVKSSQKNPLIISRVLVGKSGQNLGYKIVCGKLNLP